MSGDEQVSSRIADTWFAVGWHRSACPASCFRTALESQVACFVAENSKGRSRTGGLVELPSFFEGETKILSCFQKMCLVHEKTSAELQARDAGLQLLGGVRARS